MVMALACSFAALWLGGAHPRVAALLTGVAVLWLGLGLLRPASLAGLHRLWMALARLLHRLSSPVILGLLFFGVLSPMAWLLRRGGRDVLHLRFDAGADSYWIPRDPPGPEVPGLHDPF